jgi:Putative inner membrane exporter, YdcZ
MGISAVDILMQYRPRTGIPSAIPPALRFPVLQVFLVYERDCGRCGRYFTQELFSLVQSAWRHEPQMIASIVLDHFGLLNLPTSPASLPKLGGAVLVIAGAIVILSSRQG